MHYSRFAIIDDDVSGKNRNVTVRLLTKRLIGPAVGIAAFVIVWRFTIAARIPHLLDPSRRIAPGHLFQTVYMWLSDHEIVEFCAKSRPVAVNAKTGVEVRLSPLIQMTPKYDQLLFHPSLSPDGRSIMMAILNRTPRARADMVTATTNNKLHRLPHIPHIGTWLADSRRIAWIDGYPVEESTIGIWDSETGAVRRIALVVSDSSARSNKYSLISAIPQASPDGRLVTASSVSGDSIDIWELDLSGQKRAGKHTVRIPGQDFRSHPVVVFSPDASHAAVMLEVAVRPWYASLYQIALHKAAAESRSTQIWVVNRDGLGLHIMASEESATLRAIGDYPRQLTWTPDGRRISFLCGHTIYVFPADGG